MSGLRANIATAAALVFAVLLALQTWRLHAAQLAHRDLVTEVERDRAARTGAALKYELKTSSAERLHAKNTQENSDAFTTSQPVRDAIARADLAVADRLRRDAERRAATYRAMAEAGAAACRDSADRLAALDQHIVRGAEVVAGLRADLGRRDAEVVLLRGQIDADRALFAQPGQPDAGDNVKDEP